MATACGERDIALAGNTMANTTTTTSSPSDHVAVDNAATCTSLKSTTGYIKDLYTQSFCCGVQSTSVMSNTKDTSMEQSLIIPLLSEYYNYIRIIQEELENSSVTIEQLRLSLQYLPCLTNKESKQFVFSQATPIGQATSVHELVTELKEISSWYNHGLFSHLASLHLSNTECISCYINTLSTMCNDILLLLPAVSSGPSCPEYFEELLVFTRSKPDSYTLGEVVRLHETLSEIIGLKILVVLFQGISKTAIGSVFTFWIPTNLGSCAMMNAADNVELMSENGLAKIQGNYNTIISAPSNERRTLTDSGYGTISSSEMERVCIQEDFDKDEVFLTRVSPDSSNSAQYSTDIISHNSSSIISNGNTTITTEDESNDKVSDNHDSEDGLREDDCSTPLIAPPPGYEGGSTQTLHEDQDLDNENPNQTEEGEGIHVDTEVPKTQFEEEEDYIVMSSSTSNAPIIAGVKAEVNSPTHTISDVPLSPYLKRLSNPPTVQKSYHILNNSEDCGFVKRLLLRASPLYTANVHVVAITSQMGSHHEGLLHIELGEKLIALYMEGECTRVVNAVGMTGLLPYTACRVSIAHYGKSSKLTQLTHSYHYSMSTANIVEVTDYSDGFRQIGLLGIYVVVIRGCEGREKDEMSVSVGDNVRLLYCDHQWLYGAVRDGRAGFIPRSHCRLTRRSQWALSIAGWVAPTHQFQADFLFNMAFPPPRFLMDNDRLPSTDGGEVLTVAGNYMIPGTQYVIKRGINVRTIYHESNLFHYVGTITGATFWIPSTFTIKPSRNEHVLTFELSNMIQSVDPQETVVMRRPRAHTIAGEQGRKKVSFAKETQTAIIHSVRSSLSQSNPELSLLDVLDCTSHDPLCSTITVTHPRRSRSNENIQTIIMNSPTTLCGKIFCF